MRLPMLLPLLASALATLAAPAPKAGEVPPSIQAYIDLGIDPHGPIPGDYDHHSGNGTYHFSARSKAESWVLAQLDLRADLKRDLPQPHGYANIGIGISRGPWCTQGGLWVDNVQYNWENVGPYMFSVGISYRGLYDYEQLDFSEGGTGNLCGQYVYSAAQGMPVGCWNSQEVGCFRLWRPGVD